MAAVGLLVALAAATGIPATAAIGARVTADEPQYLLTAGSLYHRLDLDIGPDLRAETWRDYHRAELPVQTAPLPGGQGLSPHDPLLPAVLAVPVGLGGWVAAKAALAVTVAIAAITGPAGRRTTTAWVLSVAALPWLGVKYAPVAAALTLVGLGVLAAARRRGLLVGALAGLAVAAITFGAFHQAVYGGWTVYAAGNHFTDGELTVMGASPDYASRAQRLAGLLTDHDFGLLAWAPAFLAAVPAAAALVRRRPPGWLALGLPLGAGWLNATFVALTMHGWWWPGRQVVVVVPCLVLTVAWWFGTVLGVGDPAHGRSAASATRRWRGWFLAATAFGVVAWAWLLVEVARGTSTVVLDFARTTNPLSRVWRLLLPDLRVLAAVDIARQGVWVVVLAALVVHGWRGASLPDRSEHRALP